MNCDWCDAEVRPEDVTPVQMMRQSGVDGEPSDEELRTVGTFPHHYEPRQFGNACKACIVSDRFKELPAFWLKERDDRARRAENAIRRRIGAPELPLPTQP